MSRSRVSVHFILDVRIKPGSREDLARAYAALRERVEREPGLLGHQLCESIDDPERWLVISEWSSVDASSAWDQSDEHAKLIGPMRACFAQATAAKFDVRDGVRR
jgi:heme-degrading monooxygenase HmoA